MRAISRLVLIAALLIGLAPAAVSAQRWTADFGINGGGSWYSELLDDEWAGPDGARFKAGWLLGSQLTFWPAERFGLRANMTFTERPIVADGDDIAGLEDNELHGNINLWSGSIDALIRLRSPNPSWMGRETLPYIALGLGAKWQNPAGDFYTCIEPNDNQASECAPIFPPTGPLAVAESSTFMGLVGLGADFRLSPNTALRLEISDRIYQPQIFQADAPVGQQVNLPNDDTRVTNTVHEIGAQLGFHFLMGVRTPPPVAVAPPPAPPPPPPPPAPEPPREDQIQVCVVDLTAPGGLRMQTATFRHAQGDTVVMVDGERRPLTQAVTPITTARGAGWFVRGEPLSMMVGRETVRFTPYQTAQQIQPDRLAYLGNIGGYPVFADRDEVADVITPLGTLRGTRTDAELGTLLAESDRRVRDTVQGVTYLYVPIDAYGCVFQPVQRLEDVRKGGQ
jgi:hypothetical protein